jgi:hypothetical protein
MGLFTQLGQMKDLITAAPALIDSANQLAASAQTQAAMSATVMTGTTGAAGFPGTIGSQAAVDHANLVAHGEPSSAMLEPIAGVDLAAYARVSKGIAAFGYDTARLPEVARGLGIAADAWEAASLGWGARIQADRAVGSRFNQLYAAL